MSCKEAWGLNLEAAWVGARETGFQPLSQTVWPWLGHLSVLVPHDLEGLLQTSFLGGHDEVSPVTRLRSSRTRRSDGSLCDWPPPWSCATWWYWGPLFASGNSPRILLTAPGI